MSERRALNLPLLSAVHCARPTWIKSSGVDRNFVIEPHIYEGIYQISAPVAPGSSGGPLLERKTGKVLAINSARHAKEANIGFSIPIFKVYDLIQTWISSPLAEDEIYAMFYNSEGAYFYRSLEGEGYFEGGDYSEEYDTYDVWNYYDEQQSGAESGYGNFDESGVTGENGGMDDSVNESDVSDEINDVPAEEEEWTDGKQQPAEGDEINESGSYEGKPGEETADDQLTEDLPADQPEN
ncbi:S1C family serine protease [Parageobacillus thermoglucosidasius]|uniref:S1C family serine protease n=1 Tax=Parageobacillus thermoglucosidasius TaxID=1426 RepID=UPI002E22C9E8|nr:S1C family serine protease [Parageobacillus thermoglucosidasius]MED4913945.1 S1C family serine protease [Parageobacillus thermoglucosidasius]MED4943925.1 S1C family serine protease [Parageobacillus thermoglucosidasius]MED4983558.1 S1C family serine protease [Parageobacillus thermoglucosidasius]